MNRFAPSAPWENLHLRADLLYRLREFFRQRGFLEVETPLLSADCAIDRHLDPLATTFFDDPRVPDAGKTMWLQTSPEFGMKRLMAAGGEAIYQVTRSFRGGECGPLHNVEFTIVEWYRRGDSMEAGIQLLSDLADELLGAGPAERLSYAEAFEGFAGVDPHKADVARLIEAAGTHGICPPAGLDERDRDGWLDLLLVACVQPHLGRKRPAILYDYPATQAALAQVRRADPPMAERFELFVCGIELANGYHELLDPAVLRKRNSRANDHRAAHGKHRLPEESRLLAAMEHGLPECTGVALGFDRVVMIAAGAKSLKEVMAFPMDRA